MDSNNETIEGRKSGSLTVCSRISGRNIFPISRGQPSQNQVLVKKYVSAKSSTRLDLLENVIFGHRFNNKNGKKFLEAP